MESLNSSPAQGQELHQNEYSVWGFYPTSNNNITQLISSSLQPPASSTQQYDQASQICSAKSVYAPSQRRYTDGDLSSVCGKELQDYPDADPSDGRSSFYNLEQMDDDDYSY